MPEDVTAALEEQLLLRVRAGDSAAYQELYDGHLDGARQLARILVGRDGADELVSESFARVLAALRSGAGPTTNFRAYLHVTIRNGYRDSLRSTREAPVSDQPWLLDEITSTVEEMVDGLDETVATEALTSLPERWQQVLWHVEVEGRKPAEVAELMDLSPRTVSSLAHRAREGLKQAYLDLHAGPEPLAEDCQWVHARMSKSARGDLSARAQRKLDEHLDGCDDCAAAFLVVDTVNQRLAAYVLPLVLLGVVPASGKVVVWLAAAAGGTTLAGGAAGAAGSAGSAGGGSAGSSAGSSAGGPVAVAAAVVAVAAVVAGVSWALVANLGSGAAPVAAKVAPASAPPDAGPGASGAKTRPATSAARPRPVPVVRAAVTPTPASSAPKPAAPTRTPTTPSSAPTSVPTVPTSPATTPTTPASTPATTPPACGTGDLLCTVLHSVSQVLHTAGGWQIVATFDTNGGPDRLVSVVFRFARPVDLRSVPSTGWTCLAGRAPGHGSGAQAARRVSQLTCRYQYVGAQPPALTVEVSPAGPAPYGTITMQSGSDTSTRSFSG